VAKIQTGSENVIDAKMVYGRPLYSHAKFGLRCGGKV